MKLLTTSLIISLAVILSACSGTSNTSTTETPSNTATSDTTQNSDTSRIALYTMDEVAQHNSSSDCWLVVANDVLDVTEFISEHPGGDEILKGCGTDATALFASVREHSGPEAQSILPTLKIGELGSN